MGKERDIELMRRVYEVAKRESSDPRTNTAALILKYNKILAAEANKIPEELEIFPEMLERANKKYFLNHGERRTISKCAKYGNATEDSTIYTNWEPCSACGLAIVDAGIVELVLHKNLNDYYRANIKPDDIWLKDQDMALEVMRKAGIKIRYLEAKLFKSEENFSIDFRGDKFKP